jgi:autoinducer 2-degrading protein
MEKEIFVKWKIRETETPRILGLLPALVEKSRKERGNLSYNIYQSAEDTNVLILHERYVDAHAADEHKTHVHYQEVVVAQIIPCLEEREVFILNKLY